MRLVQVAQRAEDLSRATDFYRALLEAEPTASFDPPGLVFFDLAGVRLLLDRGAPSGALYLQVPDIDRAVARVHALGASIDSEPHVIFRHADDSLGPAGAHEWHAFLRDSEGNLVGLVEHRQTADSGPAA